MKTWKRDSLFFLLFSCIVIGILFGCSQMEEDIAQDVNYIDAVVGLLSDGEGGSNLVVYETDTWDAITVLELPDVISANYAAISSDGKYIAYTTWDDNYIRQYIKVYSTETQETTDFYRDLPAQHAIIYLSWMPDNKTLLFILDDESTHTYEEIRTFNVETQEEATLVKGEVWVVKTLEDDGVTPEDFYVKGADKYLSVQAQVPATDNECWNYYMTQSDLDALYEYYGGLDEFDIEEDIFGGGHMYVQFSPPRVSADGTKMIYSATLRRLAAWGSQTPLWVCSAIWLYDFNEQTSHIIYSQPDGGAIGRVDWINDNQLAFVSYYDYQGSRDSINLLNLEDYSASVLFPYTDEHYNNVTLLPIGQQRISFTSSEKYARFVESSTFIYDIPAGTYYQNDIQFNNSTVLLEKFIYNRLQENWNAAYNMQ